jgi:hypothetical protein
MYKGLLKLILICGVVYIYYLIASYLINITKNVDDQWSSTKCIIYTSDFDKKNIILRAVHQAYTKRFDKYKIQTNSSTDHIACWFKTKVNHDISLVVQNTSSLSDRVNPTIYPLLVMSAFCCCLGPSLYILFCNFDCDESPYDEDEYEDIIMEIRE